MLASVLLSSRRAAAARVRNPLVLAQLVAGGEGVLRGSDAGSSTWTRPRRRPRWEGSTSRQRCRVGVGVDHLHRVGGGGVRMASSRHGRPPPAIATRSRPFAWPTRQSNMGTAPDTLGWTHRNCDATCTAISPQPAPCRAARAGRGQWRPGLWVCCTEALYAVWLSNCTSHLVLTELKPWWHGASAPTPTGSAAARETPAALATEHHSTGWVGPTHPGTHAVCTHNST